MPIDLSWDTILKIEDYLNDKDVFYNDLNGRRKAHPDSYMTLVDFKNLDIAFEQSQFSPGEWDYAVKYWQENDNMQPPLRLVALTIARKLLEGIK